MIDTFSKKLLSYKNLRELLISFLSRSEPILILENIRIVSSAILSLPNISILLTISVLADFKNKKYNKIVKFNHSLAILEKFNYRPCAKFQKLPNITPDFIYIDGPCYMHVKGSINGINMRHKDRTLVSTDLLSIEHLLIPGTTIIWDGQKNNVNFFKKNTIRNWKIFEDRNIFIAELNEKSLGIYNDNHLKLLNG